MPAVNTAVALVLLALAVREDLVCSRIPNNLTLAGLVLGLGLAGLDAGVEGGVSALCGALAGMAALLPLHLLRGMGAGDVKLMGAAGSFLGPTNALLAAALALVAGVAIAVAIVVWRLTRPAPLVDVALAGGARAGGGVPSLISVARKERFPYAVAIATGVVLTFWLDGSVGSLISAVGIG